MFQNFDYKAPKLTKEEKQLKYFWIQVENWLTHRFKNSAKTEVKVITGLTRKAHVFAMSMIKNGSIITLIDKQFLNKSTKEKLVETAAREAIRIHFLTHGKTVKETDPEFKEQLDFYGLPYYDIYPEDGLDLYEYRCSDCQKIITLSRKKIPKSKKITYNPLKVTSCCKAVIKESDQKQHYDNLELQRIKNIIGDENVK